MESKANIELLNIPDEFMDMFNFFKKKIASLGVDIIEECEVLHKEPYTTLLECWTMFQSACYSYRAGDVKVAYFLYNYINSKLKLNLIKLDYSKISKAYFDFSEEMLVLIGEEYSIKDDVLVIKNGKIKGDTLIIQ